MDAMKMPRGSGCRLPLFSLSSLYSSSFPPPPPLPPPPPPPPSSPYPKIDAYVLNHVIRDAGVVEGAVRCGVVEGAVRRSAFFADRKILVYDVKDYRFCRRVGRHHNSNNIRIVVDVVRASWHQRCLDPDCDGFRSNEFPIPAAVVETETTAGTMTATGTTTTTEVVKSYSDDNRDDLFCGEEAEDVDAELDDDALFDAVVELERGGGESSGGGDDVRASGGSGDVGNGNMRSKGDVRTAVTCSGDDFSDDDESFAYFAENQIQITRIAENELGDAVREGESEKRVNDDPFSDDEDFLLVSSGLT